jgi:hypothetical protein
MVEGSINCVMDEGNDLVLWLSLGTSLKIFEIFWGAV